MRRCARESHNGLLKLLKKQVSSQHADSRRRGKKENKKAGWATPPHPITVTSDFLDRFYISKTHRTLVFTCWQLVVKAGVLDGLWSAGLDLYSIFKKAAARCHFSLWSALPFLKVTVCPPPSSHLLPLTPARLSSISHSSWKISPLHPVLWWMYESICIIYWHTAAKNVSLVAPKCSWRLEEVVTLCPLIIRIIARVTLSINHISGNK